MKWLWIDPGATVGWAKGYVSGGPTTIYVPETDELPILEPTKLDVEDWGQHKAKTFIMQLLETAQNYDVIGYESYAIRADKLKAHAGSNVPTLQVIGGIRAAAWQGQARNSSGFPQIVDQAPREKTTGMASSKIHLAHQPEVLAVIKEALAGPHDDGHYGDALLHAVAWFHLKYPGGNR